jgi:hypothetical protein
MKALTKLKKYVEVLAPGNYIFTNSIAGLQHYVVFFRTHNSYTISWQWNIIIPRGSLGLLQI